MNTNVEIWQDIIGKNVIVVISEGGFREGKVIRLSPNGQAVQLDYADPLDKEHHRPILYWEPINLQIIDILPDYPKPTTSVDSNVVQLKETKPWWALGWFWRD